jgi:hypothetical protein
MDWGKPHRTKATRGRELVIKVYDTVHIALWSLLGAFVIFFCVFTLPQMPKLRAEMQAKIVLDLAAENRHYCTKWGFAPGSEKHAACILDLQELRAKIDRRASDEAFP